MVHLLVASPGWAVLPHTYGQRRLGFCRQSQGVLKFSEGLDKWELPRIYLGEKASTSKAVDVEFSPMDFQNTGQSPLTLTGPTWANANPAIQSASPWISVSWEKLTPPDTWRAVPAGTPLKLDVEEWGRLHLDLDTSLIGIGTGAPPTGGILADATIEIGIQEQRQGKPLPVRIPSIRPRPDLDTILAVDFGTSNTLVAYANETAARRHGSPIFDLVTVPLAKDDHENNPTALFFKNVNNRQHVIIGNDALGQGQKVPAALRSGLKRALVVDGALSDTAEVEDGAGNRNTTLTNRDLILIYLERLLMDCEAKLRQNILRVCFSHPANYGPRPRLAFQEIIDDLERNWKKRREGRTDDIKFSRLEIDEASAVAFQFVLDDHAFDNEIVPIVEKRNPQRFVVASIDVGGGSVDLSLVVFERIGNGRLVYSSELCGIGGDETLGGDNFTTAVFELLRNRLIAIVEKSAYELPLVSLNDDRRGRNPVAWNNTTLLWDLSETVKKETFRLVPNRNALENAATDFQARVRVKAKSGDRSFRNWADMSELKAGFATEFLATAQWLAPEEIYAHEIGIDRVEQRGYKLGERLTDCLKKIDKYLNRARARLGEPGLSLDFIVMAGSGSRIPLIKSLMKGWYPNATFHDEALLRPKEKVAVGLARYYRFSLLAPGRVRRLALASNYTHADIGWHGPAEVVVFIESCSKLGSDEEIIVDLPDALENYLRSDRFLHVARVGSSAGRTRHL